MASSDPYSPASDPDLVVIDLQLDGEPVYQQLTAGVRSACCGLRRCDSAI